MNGLADDPRVADRPAIDGGPPVRAAQLPYGRPWIDEADRAAVLRVLEGEWLTTGPEVEALESAWCAAVGARHAVAVSNGTAALHAALHVLDLQPGDEVLVPAITFAATANAVRYVGARPVFVDVDEDALLFDPSSAARCVTSRTRALVAVDFAGQACDYGVLHSFAAEHRLTLIADACHALGGSFRGRPVGSLAEMSTFSLHPVKAVTAGEGGMVTTDDPGRAERLRRFRNHGLVAVGARLDTWENDQAEWGFNYRLSDLACALARNQLYKLPEFLAARRLRAARYLEALADHAGLRPLAVRPEVEHAWHLFVVKMIPEQWSIDRKGLFAALRAEGIGVQVHYRPVYWHTTYAQAGYRRGLCPRAERAYESLLSLPVFPGMSDGDQHDVLVALAKLSRCYGRGN